MCREFSPKKSLLTTMCEEKVANKPLLLVKNVPYNRSTVQRRAPFLFNSFRLYALIKSQARLHQDPRPFRFNTHNWKLVAVRSKTIKRTISSAAESETFFPCSTVLSRQICCFLIKAVISML